MSFPARLPPKEDEWVTDWVPSKRPIQLPLPKLEYDSHFEVWEWQFRNLLKHNSLLGFIHFLGPSVTPTPVTWQQKEEIAAATHCLSLLGSCVSEHILADLITISQDNKLPDDPCRLFRDVKKLVTDVHTLCAGSWSGANPQLWSLLTGRTHAFSTIHQLLEDLEGVHRRIHKKELRRDLIFMTTLLVKRNFPSCRPDFLRKYINKAKDMQVDVGVNVWLEMRSELSTMI